MNVRRVAAKPALSVRIKHAARWLGGILMTGFVLSVVAGVSVAAVMTYQWLDRPIEVIAVKGQFKHIQPGELEALVAPVIDGGIVSLDLVRIDDELETHVWIKQAAVSRQWPNGIQIEVVEETPIARWGSKGFLNSQGELLDVADNSPLKELPLLIGPEGLELDVMKRYREVAHLMQTQQLRIAEMNVDEVGFWYLRLFTGPELLVGSDDVMNKIRRFLIVWEQSLASKAGQLATVDLRYDNGLAVKWLDSETGKAAGRG